MTSPSEKSPQGGPRALGRVLEGLMGPRALGRSRRVSRELCAAWLEVAGPEVAEHTRVHSLRRGILTVVVASAPLCHQLASFRRDELLGALRHRVRGSDVQSLRFRHGSF